MFGDDSFKFKLLPAFITLTCFSVLCALGTWQLHRLEWKKALIERIETRSEDLNVLNLSSLNLYPYSEAIGDDGRDIEFFRVSLTGNFLNTNKMYLMSLNNSGKLGFQLLVPFQDINDRTFIVDLGWVSEEENSLEEKFYRELEGETYLEGVAEIYPKPNIFKPDNDPGRNLWYNYNVDQMSDFVNFNLEPIIVRSYVVDGYLTLPNKKVTNRNNLRNDHLSYAITWFGLSVSILIIYFIYLIKGMKEKNGGKS